MTKKLNYSFKNVSYINSKKNSQSTIDYRFYFSIKFLEFLETDHEIISIDECGLSDDISFKKNWSLVGERCGIEKQGSLKNITLTVAISQSGILGIKFRDGALDSIGYHHYLIDLINSLKTQEKFKDKKLVVIMDNARIHNTTLIKNTLLNSNFIALFNPPYSPNTNPVEYLFKDLKHKLSEKSSFKK